eukprot:121202-Alexandrium_andersonii.AAC.1
MDSAVAAAAPAVADVANADGLGSDSDGSNNDVDGVDSPVDEAGILSAGALLAFRDFEDTWPGSAADLV